MNKEQMEFMGILAQEFPKMKIEWLLDACQKILRVAQRHQNLATEYCNRDLTEREIKEYEDGCEEILIKIRDEYFDGKLGWVLSGDPRGCTVKLTVPSGRTNDWGREGICVPTK